jgi:hypothetical protein
MKHARMLAATLALAVPMAHAYTLVLHDSRDTGGGANSVAFGDTNGDGRKDIIVTTGYAAEEQFRYFALVHLQQPDGTFAVALKYPYPPSERSEVSIANLDGDLAQEIVVGHSAGITILDWDTTRGQQSMSSRTYGNEWGRPAENIALLDINRDGVLDVVGKGFGRDVLLHVSDGQGGIRNIIRIPLSINGYNDLTVGDFNADGYQDYAVVSSVLRAYVILNNGITEPSPPVRVINPNPTGVAVAPKVTSGDFNDDGRDDLVMVVDATELGFFTQTADHQLVLADTLDTESYPATLLGNDFDLDGRDDLLMQLFDGPLTLLLQAAGGVLEPIEFENVPGRNFAVGDIDGDDCTDLVIARGEMAVYRGEGCHPIADLAVTLSLTDTVVAVRLDNFGAAAAAAPETTVTLTVSKGTLSLGALPRGCAITAQEMRSTRLVCSSTDLAAGDDGTMLFSVSITGSVFNHLTASASTKTTAVELHLGNNEARKSAQIPRLALGSQRSIATKKGM